METGIAILGLMGLIEKIGYIVISIGTAIVIAGLIAWWVGRD